MGYSIGYDSDWRRDIGYGVPAECDHPDCKKEIHRGMAYVCDRAASGGLRVGCGLFFCDDHQSLVNLCERCYDGRDPFEPTPDIPEWLIWKLTDESWGKWRESEPTEVEQAWKLLLMYGLSKLLFRKEK